MDYNEQLAEKLEDLAKIKSETQLYRRRWFILFMFMAYTIAAGIQWMQYSIVTNFMMRYYHVEAYQVEWTTMLHMLIYIFTILPALWFLDTFGNRISMLVASGGVCLGAIVKMLAVRPDFWWVVMIGQGIEATSQVLTFGLAGSVTAAWFGPHEIALAGSLASFGDLFGSGLGFVYPTLFINNLQTDEEIGRGLYDSCVLLSIYTAAVFIVVLLFFQDQPKKPPSNAQIVRIEKRTQSNPVRDLVQMLKKKSLLMILLTYGIHISIFFSHGTLLNRTFIYYFPNHEKDGGWVGCIIILSGMIGSLIGGYFLDRKHLFKETTYIFYICSALCLTAYTMAFHYRQLILVYVFACMLGIFMFGYYATTLQLAYEVIHPQAEGTAAGLALCSVQIISLILTPVYREIFEKLSPLIANFSLIFLQVVGILLTFCIPAKYRRQQAEMVLKYGETAQVFIKEIENDTD